MVALEVTIHLVILLGSANDAARDLVLRVPSRCWIAVRRRFRGLLTVAELETRCGRVCSARARWYRRRRRRGHRTRGVARCGLPARQRVARRHVAERPFGSLGARRVRVLRRGLPVEAPSRGTVVRRERAAATLASESSPCRTRRAGALSLSAFRPAICLR